MQGLLIVNKDIGYTSQDVVSKVKRILNVKKVGHTGTLDPMATGVLPILIGDYTKLSKYLVEHDKTYVATIKLGIKTDTLDQEGTIIEETEFDRSVLEKENVESVLESFKGDSMQVPPMYSAIKKDGKKLYEYAREGKEVELEARPINISEIKLLEILNDTNEIRFEVSCSKGTYIRSLCNDIAVKLGTIGYMSNLSRVRVDRFYLKDAISLDDLAKLNSEEVKQRLINMESIFDDMPKINLRKNAESLFLNGVCLTYKFDDGIYHIYNDSNKYIGLGIIKDNLLKRDVVITED